LKYFGIDPNPLAVILNSLRQHYIYKEQNKGFSENLKNIAAKFLISLKNEKRRHYKKQKQKA
jgi:hypothetical protein